MRAWHYSAVAVLVAACGGSESNIDGGTDANGLPDVNNVLDSGNPQDSTTSDVVAVDSPAEATVEAGPFDPSQLAGLALWLDASKNITQANGAITVWGDLTANHNDASGATHGPTLQTAAVNNLPAVDFSGAFNNPQYLTITDSASLEFGTGDFAIYMVAEYQNPSSGNGAGQGTFYYKVAGNTTPTGPQLYGNAGAGGNTYVSSVRARINLNDNVNSTATGLNDGKFHRIGIRRNGSAIEVWTDDTATSFTPDAGAGVDVSAVGTDVNIGAQFTGQFAEIALHGGIAEVIGVNGTISDNDVASLDAYFKAKYAL